jgi:hypothetical protein
MKHLILALLLATGLGSALLVSATVAVAQQQKDGK